MQKPYGLFRFSRHTSASPVHQNTFSGSPLLLLTVSPFFAFCFSPFLSVPVSFSFSLSLLLLRESSSCWWRWWLKEKKGKGSEAQPFPLNILTAVSFPFFFHSSASSSSSLLVSRSFVGQRKDPTLTLSFVSPHLLWAKKEERQKL